MKKFLIIILVFMAVSPLIYLWLHPVHRWHQKITVEIETPEGIKSGSSVQSISWKESSRIGPYFPGTQYANPSFKGEAVVIEVLPGKHLFGLLKGKSHLGDPHNLALGLFGGDTTIKKSAPYIKNAEGPIELPEARYPLFVKFIEINNPASVIEVSHSDLQTYFGDGVRIKRVTIEITDEPVTSGQLEKVLGWLDQYYNKKLDGRKIETIKSQNRFANSLSSGNFKAK